MNLTLKTVIKYILYVVSLPLILIGSFDLFINHPEVQIAFWVPGILLVVFSVIHDDLYSHNLRMFKVRLKDKHA